MIQTAASMGDTEMIITKELVQAHIRCPRLAHAKIYRPQAPTADELDRMVEGQRVGQEARDLFPGGVLIATHANWPERIQATERSLCAGASVIFEAAFQGPDDLRAVVDVLQVDGDALRVIEVKAATGVKEGHLHDLSFQSLVLGHLGYNVVGGALLYLNPAFRSGSTREPLLVSKDLSSEVCAGLRKLPDHIEALRKLVPAEAPPPRYRTSCKACPWRAECEPADPDHIRTLYHVREPEATRFVEDGIPSLAEIPTTWKTSSVVRRRQVEAARSGLPVIDHEGLRSELVRLGGKTIAHIDFETTQFSIPRYHGMAPWAQLPVQWSCHTEHGNGSVSHAEWLAEDTGDPREEFARTLLAATAGAEAVTVWNAKFEQGVIAGLAELLPQYRPALHALNRRIVDLLQVVRDNLYHPEFRGSFSLKRVLPVLVPSLSYKGMAIANGGVAAVELKRVLYDATIPEEDRQLIRQHLLEYCQLDTLAMVELLSYLRTLC